MINNQEQKQCIEIQICSQLIAILLALTCPKEIAETRLGIFTFLFGLSYCQIELRCHESLTLLYFLELMWDYTKFKHLLLVLFCYVGLLFLDVGGL